MQAHPSHFSTTVGVRPGAGFNRMSPCGQVALQVCRGSRGFALKQYPRYLSGTSFVYDVQFERELGQRQNARFFIAGFLRSLLRSVAAVRLRRGWGCTGLGIFVSG
jgi:hypothetical protein